MRRFYAVLGFAALACSLARAEFPPPTFPDEPGEDQRILTPKQRREAKPKPPPAVKKRTPPISSEENEEGSVPKPDFTKRFRFFAMGGLSSLSSKRSEIESSLSQFILKDHFSLGAFGDYQFNRIFGIEWDGFFATTPLQTGVFPDSHEETRKMMEWSALAGVRAEYVFAGEIATWRPRLGVGYGLLSISQFSGTPSGDGNQVGTMSGFYLSLGLEVLLGKWITLLSDYAVSVGATGSYVSTGVGGDTQEGLAGPSYSRLRIGCVFPAWESIYVGGIFTLRGIYPAVSYRSNLYFGQGEQATQFMAVAGFEM